MNIHTLEVLVTFDNVYYIHHQYTRLSHPNQQTWVYIHTYIHINTYIQTYVAGRFSNLAAVLYSSRLNFPSRFLSSGCGVMYRESNPESKNIHEQRFQLCIYIHIYIHIYIFTYIHTYIYIPKVSTVLKHTTFSKYIRFKIH